ncbi:MAG: O-antigen ligase family protein [Propionivibrio sp.]
MGLLALLTGMFWIGEHGNYPKVYQYFVALPTIFLILLYPHCIVEQLDSSVGRMVVAFFGLVLLSLFWAHPESGVLALLRRPVVVVLTFFAVHEVAAKVPRRFELVLMAALILATCFAAYALGRFALDGGGKRLSGYGALYNPLLVSHVFGFFGALGLGYYFADRRLLAPTPLVVLALLGAILVATGSRTPLVAMAATLFWLAALTANRKAVSVLSVVVAAGVISWVVWPELFMQRGFSYRPQIWLEATRQIREAPWFGHGFNTPMRIKLDDFDFAFVEPHNLTLSVMYDLGLAGVLAWLGIYANALKTAWMRRTQPLVLVVSATVVYGLFAGMTEGGAYLSRPKEHWFIVWIPIALLSALIRKESVDRGTA